MRHAEVEFDLTLDSPAFLGNAQQSAEWRTPPIKALLRQMWRIVKWNSEHAVANASTERLAIAEASLFGCAADQRSCRSRVSLVHVKSGPGRALNWKKEDTLPHPEVNRPVSPYLYLGFGPILIHNEGNQKRFPGARVQADARTNLWVRSHLNAGTSATFRLRFPQEFADELAKTLQLMDVLGAVGSRARNGWGTIRVSRVADNLNFALATVEASRAQRMAAVLREHSQPLVHALVDAPAHAWPRCIGADDKGLLLWRTRETRAHWEDVIRDLAAVKVAIRAGRSGEKDRFLGLCSQGNDIAGDRHYLAYPVTRHAVAEWDAANGGGNDLRLPNQLWFRVMKESDAAYRGYIVHLPWIPHTLTARRVYSVERAVEIWKKVHRRLDDRSLGLTERVAAQ